MSGLGLFASGIFIWAVLEMIIKIKSTKSADDFSILAGWLWVVGLGIFSYISIKTGAHWVIKYNYVLNTILYIYLLYLVYKYQGEYKMPKKAGKFDVYKGGKFVEKVRNGK